jgi:hypothetical protein
MNNVAGYDQREDPERVLFERRMKLTCQAGPITFSGSSASLRPRLPRV